MHKLEDIADRIRQNFDVRTAKRDEALKLARQLTRTCSLSIRAVHRDDKEAMESNLAEAHSLADRLRNELKEFPDLCDLSQWIGRSDWRIAPAYT